MRNFFSILALLLFSFVTLHCQTVISLSVHQPEELIADAGNNDIITPGTQVTLGEIPVVTGGTEPYSYSWSYLSNTISNLANPSVYPQESATYTVLVTDRNFCSAVDSITIGIATVIDDLYDEMRIFPNPASGNIIIELAGQNATVFLYNEQGTLLWSKQIHDKSTFPVPGTPGIYLLRIQGVNALIVKRIIVTGSY